MKVLDLDLDYFMEQVFTDISESETVRIEEDVYGELVWSTHRVVNFLENNLGLSKQRKIPGRIINDHKEAMSFWRELIDNDQLTVPFEVVHVDSHADLGNGYFSSCEHIMAKTLAYPVEERSNHCNYTNAEGERCGIGNGDYLVYALAFRWIDKLTYCGNPNGSQNDYYWPIIKDFEEQFIWETPVLSTIQLLHNANDPVPNYNDPDNIKKNYLARSTREPEIPFLIIPTIEAVSYPGDFDFAVMAKSPIYTPESADFILDIFKEYIDCI